MEVFRLLSLCIIFQVIEAFLLVLDLLLQDLGLFPALEFLLVVQVLQFINLNLLDNILSDDFNDLDVLLRCGSLIVEKIHN